MLQKFKYILIFFIALGFMFTLTSVDANAGWANTGECVQWCDSSCANQWDPCFDNCATIPPQGGARATCVANCKLAEAQCQNYCFNMTCGIGSDISKDKPSPEGEPVD